MDLGVSGGHFRGHLRQMELFWTGVYIPCETNFTRLVLNLSTFMCPNLTTVSYSISHVSWWHARGAWQSCNIWRTGMRISCSNSLELRFSKPGINGFFSTCKYYECRSGGWFTEYLSERNKNTENMTVGQLVSKKSLEWLNNTLLML